MYVAAALFKMEPTSVSRERLEDAEVFPAYGIETSQNQLLLEETLHNTHQDLEDKKQRKKDMKGIEARGKRRQRGTKKNCPYYVANANKASVALLHDCKHQVPQMRGSLQPETNSF